IIMLVSLLHHPSPPFSIVSLSFPLPSLSIPEVPYCKKDINLHTLDTRCRERSRGGRLETVWMLYLLFWKNRLISVGKKYIPLILKRVPSCRHGNQQLPLADFCHKCQKFAICNFLNYLNSAPKTRAVCSFCRDKWAQ
uniref:Uncharacterized protein n=1 Tax=Takifugu rubripes TaxID=31033 RepID=A0A674MJS1_TAKRU